MVGPKGAVVATLAVGGGALGIYALGLREGWWTLPTWLGGPAKPTPAQVAAERARRAALEAAAREGRPFPGEGAAPGFAPGAPVGYIGNAIAESRERRATGRYAFRPLIAYSPEPGALVETGAGLTAAENRRVLDRIFQGSLGR